MKTTDEWREVLIACGVDSAIAMFWGDVFADVVKENTFSKGIKEVDDFLGQVLHESGYLERMEENLNYSAARLTVIWPRRFPTEYSALPYARNSVALANKVYGGRMGNTEPGDGWRYRGRAPIQITGKDNYRLVGDLMGQDLLANPDLLIQPRFALEATIAWWEDRIPDGMIGDVESVTRRVNGGLHGLLDRERLTGLAKGALS